MTLCRQLEVEGPESTAPTLTLGMGAEGGRRGGSQTPGGGAGPSTAGRVTGRGGAEVTYPRTGILTAGRGGGPRKRLLPSPVPQLWGQRDLAGSLRPRGKGEKVKHSALELLHVRGAVSLKVAG